MTKDFWINLPVKDLNKSKEFFKALGFTINERFSDSEQMAGIVIGEHNSMIMLFPEATLQTFAGHELTDTSKSIEVLLSISADSREEVHEMCQQAVQAGGTVFSEPGESNGFYGAGFSDLDGHRWNLLIM
ncbi:VOC family protein [Planococcus shenhongbingii]|uniref:VOC family protein n=1 Tax=Planococcus shenhongbingii TaxID=3058398 RepID=A0ABT8NGC7_9BACL|nr:MULTISPECIES: VOC family protein [unclassified Planococcus (in: firmicutes)]MDN7246944.1 VOC family protein [Planococcus sp. N017]WKA56847.1 VOC family protein [Planococcus sp. N016]